MLIAVTRPVSPTIAGCELEHLERQPIDAATAAAQHAAYEARLAGLGARIVRAPAAPELPDAVFVEDPAIVLDEVAVMTRMWSPVRRKESASLEEVLARFRSLRRLREPATLEGGDVIRIGRQVFVGLTRRSNREGIAQLGRELEPYGYTVLPVETSGCLHLKSGCCYLGEGTLIANRAWVDAAQFGDWAVVDIPPEEPFAANVLAVGRAVIASSSFPRTAERLAKAGWDVRLVDNSELRKAEAGITCTSLLFESEEAPSESGSAAPA